MLRSGYPVYLINPAGKKFSRKSSKIITEPSNMECVYSNKSTNPSIIFLSKSNPEIKNLALQDPKAQTNAVLHLLDGASHRFTSKTPLKQRMMLKVEKCTFGPYESLIINQIDWNLYRRTNRRFLWLNYQLKSYVFNS